MKKNIFTACILIPVIMGNISVAFAQQTPSESPSATHSIIKDVFSANSQHKEQNSCLNILAKYVKEDNRFSGLDLKKVQAKSGSTKEVDLTDYNGEFQEATAKKLWTNDNLYKANRNNIGTIRLNDSYLVSEFVAFGETTSFRFPYVSPGSSQDSGSSIMDSYGDLFKEKIVYTHHIKWNEGATKKGKFVSCGFLKITPQDGFTHQNLSADHYKTNFLTPSGFELLKNPTAPEIDKYGNEFIVGRVNVPIRNYDNAHHMTIELITVAWNNKSSYFNEFETFPLQVKAMVDEDEKKDVNSAQERFLRYVKEKTCLKAIHPDQSTLPEECNGKFSSGKKTEISRVKENTIWNIFFPRVFAENANVADEEIVVDEENTEDDHSFLPRGMYFREGFSYENLEKINALNDPLLKQHILKAISDGVEKEMEQNMEGDNLSAHSNRVFLQCGMDYETRVKLLNEWVSSIDVDTFNVNNITYPDPKLGDCIIPYPDVRHKDTIIENSFLTNQYYAAVATNNAEKIAELEPKVGLGKYIHTDDVSLPQKNTTLLIILGSVLLVGGVALLVFLLRRKK